MSTAFPVIRLYKTVKKVVKKSWNKVSKMIPRGCSRLRGRLTRSGNQYGRHTHGSQDSSEETIVESPDDQEVVAVTSQAARMTTGASSSSSDGGGRNRMERRPRMPSLDRKALQEMSKVAAPGAETGSEEDQKSGSSSSKQQSQSSSHSSSFKGSIGRPLHVVTNHYELRWNGQPDTKFTVHQYRVEFKPADMSVHIKKTILANGKTYYNGGFIYDGGAEFYCSNKFEDLSLRQQQQNPANEAIDYECFLTYTKELHFTHEMYHQIYNLIVRKCLMGMGLDEIGHNYFDTEASIDYPALKVELWPGYITKVKDCEHGILLCVDITHKVVRLEDMMTFIKALTAGFKDTAGRRGADSLTLEEFLNNNVRGSIVITPYNKFSYKILGVALDQSPLSTFKRADDTEISFKDYYRTKHLAKITNDEQPMLLGVPSGKSPKNNTVLLIPELCQRTGLTEEMRANMGMMRQLSKHLHMEPKERFEMLQKFILKLGSSPRTQETLTTWGFKLEMKPIKCCIGRVLPSENVVFKQRRATKADDKNDWSRALRTNQVLNANDLTKWLVMVDRRDQMKARDFVNMMKTVSKGMGFQVADPLVIEGLTDTREANYVRTIEKALQTHSRNSIQLVMCVLPNNKSDLYVALKRRLTQDYAIASQCILSKNLSSKAAMSIATKVSLQVATKIGGEPWTVEIPQELNHDSICIGFDFFVKGIAKGGLGLKLGAMVSTTNQDHSRYFSVAIPYHDPNELTPFLVKAVEKCMDAYKEINKGAAPTSVIFFRGSVDDGMISTGRIATEANALKEVLDKWYARISTAKLSFAYIIVSKQISSARVLTHKNRCDPAKGVTPDQIINPPPGTILDQGIVPRDTGIKEYYLVPTVARQGTVRPIYYRIIVNTHNWSADVLQSYTYKMCHLYFNWCGAVNVPSVCQYASKLAKQAALAHPFRPNTNLANRLHFL